MKKLLTTFGLLFTIATATFAQTPPNAFSYSAVARDANSNPIATTTIGSAPPTTAIVHRGVDRSIVVRSSLRQA